VDFVLVGSEAVLESGGLINAVGSSQIAIIAKAFGKPFYALAERLFFSFPPLGVALSHIVDTPATNSTGYFHFHSTTFPTNSPTFSPHLHTRLSHLLKGEQDQEAQ
jgi:hypothetical protein